MPWPLVATQKSNHTLTQECKGSFLGKKKVFSCLCKVFSIRILGLKNTHHSRFIRISKTSTVIPEMLSTMDYWLRTNDEVTASKLRAKLHEWCTNFPDVDLSTVIKG